MIDLKQLIDIINKETLTQMQVAKKIKRNVRTVKRLTKSGKLKALRVKSTTLYNKHDLNIKKEL